MTGEPITTPYFKVPAGVMVRRLMGRWLRLWGVLAALPPLALLIVAAATHDLRWALVALMTAMVIMPMVMILIYYSYALRPEVARAVVPHRLIITRGVNVRIEYRPDPERRTPPDETIAWQRISLLRDCGAYWLLIFSPDNATIRHDNEP